MTTGIPPHSKEAEVSFLGSCLVSTECIEYGLEIGLKGDDFYSRDHATVWRGMTKLYDAKKPVDNVTMFAWLEEDGSIEMPASFLSNLASGLGMLHNAQYYAQIIRDKSIRRNLLQAAAEIAAVGYDEAIDIESMLDRAELSLRRTKDKAPQQGRDPSPSDIIERMEGSKASGVQTRFPSLNAISAGLVKGHLWVVGGFSSTGKSAFGVNLMEDVVRSGSAAMMASTEMSQEQYMLRMLSLTSGVPQRTIRHGGMTMEQGAAYSTARDFWKSGRVRIFDDLYNVTRIRRMAKKVKESMGLDVLFVDFIQNLSETGDEVKDARIAAIQLQALAKELDICVVALSQISNAQAIAQNESGAMGNYYAFKGSGAIKDAADIAIMLDRDRVNKPDVLWANVVKNRHDRLDRIGLWFGLETGRLDQMTIEEAIDADPNAGRKVRRNNASE